MLVSPFTFYRGAAKLMAADLKDTPPPAWTSSCAATPTKAAKVEARRAGLGPVPDRQPAADHRPGAGPGSHLRHPAGQDGGLLRDQFRAYRATLRDDHRQLLERFEPVDMGRKVVGVGSAGTRAFIVLLQGRDQDDPLFLQLKEASASVLEDHLPASRRAVAATGTGSRPGPRRVRGELVIRSACPWGAGGTR
jgi:uncharacterized protein (DUF2252 family)